MNDFNQEEFEKLKDSVSVEYKKIASIYSPALKAEIFFNAKGLYHLRYDTGHHERNKSVQRNKLRFFHYAADIIKLSTTIQEYRRDNCRISKSGINKAHKVSLVEWFAFFAVISFLKKIRVKIVVRRVGGESGRFHFWSVMPFWSLNNGKRAVGLKEIEDN